MSTYSSQFNNGKSIVPGGSGNNPLVDAARTSAADALEYQLWVSQQSTTLSKLKIFHTMAKSVNDQQ
jgi:hypothetical protein